MLVAGALAEAGVTRLTVQRPGAQSEELVARSTDLPGLLAALPPGTELRAQLARITIREDGVGWESDSRAFVRAMQEP